MASNSLKEIVEQGTLNIADEILSLNVSETDIFQKMSNGYEANSFFARFGILQNSIVCEKYND